MTKPNEKLVEFPRQSARDILTDVLRDGAQQMLATAIEAEVDDYLAGRASTVDAAGRRYVVRNGHLPPRAIQTPLGDVQVQQPRVRDRRPTDERETFRSAILPPYLRKTPSLEALYPWLYLKGISTGDFGEALQALLGPEARGLSATTITRLKAVWEQEYQDWSKRSLAHRSYAHVWADGVYFNTKMKDECRRQTDVRLEDTDNKRQGILVLMGAPRDGTKELIAITDGYRESEQSWRELLLDVRHRGLTIDPELAIGDGGLGFWGAVRKVFPQTREQRCWVHKTANVLNKLPTGVQPKAKAMLYDIWMAETQPAADRAFDLFLATFAAKFPAATTCLAKDRDVRLTFYAFPAEHWIHIRTTNPVESTFATVRLRTKKTKGAGSRVACLTMVFKLAMAAQKHWRALNGSQLIADVIDGVPFVDGVRKEAA